MQNSDDALAEVISLRILLIEDNENDVILIRESLAELQDIVVELIDTDRLSAAMERLSLEKFDVVVSDLNLPDSRGLDTASKLRGYASHIPFVVLTGLDDESMGLKAVREGAQDYLVKSPQLDGPLLLRVLRYAIERKKAELTLQESMRFIQLVVDKAPHLMYVFDLMENRNVYSNRALFSLLGYTSGQIRAMDNQVIDELIHPDDLPRIRHHIKQVANAKDDEFLEVEYRIRHANGEWRWFHGRDTIFRRTPVGMPDLIFGMAEDITWRKQTEIHQVRICAAKEIQRQLLPPNAPRLPGFDIAGQTYPAETVTADYFDFIPLSDGSLSTVVGDVQSHGLGPAIVMAHARACLRTLSQTNSDLGYMLLVTSRLIAEDFSADRLGTLFLGKLDPRARSFVYASAGQSAFLVNGSAEARVLEATGAPLGRSLNSPIPCAPSVGLQPGHLLVMPSDGFLEAKSPKGEIFGLKHLLRVIERYRDASAHDLIEIAYREVRLFTHEAPQSDDMTLVLVKVQE
jgi:PAS domain S-box-containing protein